MTNCIPQAADKGTHTEYTTMSSGLKKVTFGNLTIQEFPIQLGDNPACSAGAPIEIGWKPFSKVTRNIDLYEYMQGSRRRRTRKDLAIPVHKRCGILLRAGYALEDIVGATLKVALAKKQRVETLQHQGWDRLTLIMIRTGQLPKGILNGALESTAGSFNKAKSLPRGIVKATGRTLKRISQPMQRTKSARMA
jgi:hypothetical protein